MVKGRPRRRRVDRRGAARRRHAAAPQRRQREAGAGADRGGATRGREEDREDLGDPRQHGCQGLPRPGPRPERGGAPALGDGVDPPKAGVFSQNFLAFAPAIKAGGAFSALGEGRQDRADRRARHRGGSREGAARARPRGKIYLLTGPVALSLPGGRGRSRRRSTESQCATSTCPPPRCARPCSAPAGPSGSRMTSSPCSSTRPRASRRGLQGTSRRSWGARRGASEDFARDYAEAFR